uniref:NADH-ubiquinone oxidoreductase chain 2 n=1 Tax=Empria sp. TaxID=2821552 RepID=A0A8A6C803_9HYME|nr:NADH dehydrogenase subunit 2 [Empria sp.]
MTKFLFIKNKISKLSLMKFNFYIMLFMSTMISINSSSWINAWMGMEINLMSFIPLMMMNSKKNSNSMMMYFIIQAGASSMLIMMIILMKLQINLNKIFSLMNCMQLSLMLKLGASPLHWWMPKIMINLNWMNCFMLLTWQKIAPLFLLMTTNNNMMIYIMSIMSTMIGAIMGLNQTSIKLIMSYSSINHLGWMLMTMIINMKMMIIYFMIYSLISMMICIIMNNNKFNFINQLFKNNNQNINIKLILMSLFLSLSGLPPMIGFLPKLFTLMLMIKNNMFMETIMFIILATISLSYYINPMMSMLILTKSNLKWNYKNNNINKIFKSILMFNMLIIMIMLTPMMNNIL